MRRLVLCHHMSSLFVVCVVCVVCVISFYVVIVCVYLFWSFKTTHTQRHNDTPQQPLKTLIKSLVVGWGVSLGLFMSLFRLQPTQRHITQTKHKQHIESCGVWVVCVNLFVICRYVVGVCKHITTQTSTYNDKRHITKYNEVKHL